MKLYPAIDLLGGRAVRLERGDRDKATVYSEQPVELVDAMRADRLHVVDLDGAFAGSPQQTALIARIVAAANVPVEVGGGIRDRAGIDALRAAGASYVVLGTAAVRDPAFVEEACKLGQVIVAVDARDGVVAVDGWTKSGGITAIELGQRAAGWGAAGLLYTDVSRDGLHVGPNVAATAALQAAVSCEVIASGGVGALDHLRALKDAGIAAVVVGKALYDQKFTLAEALAACR